MNPKLLELHNRVQATIGQTRTILDRALTENRDLTGDERREHDRLSAEADGLISQIERIQKLDQTEAALNGTDPDSLRYRPDPEKSLALFGGGGSSNNSSQPRALRDDESFARFFGHESAARELRPDRWLRGVFTGQWDGAKNERFLTTTSGGGEYTIPAPIVTQLLDVVRNESGIFRLCKQVPMLSATLDYPVATADPTAYWRAEGARITPSDPTLTSVELKAKTCGVIVKVSRELLADSPMDLGMTLQNMLTRAMAEELDRIILFGRGLTTYNEPLGVTNTASINTLDAAGPLTSYAKLSEVYHSILGNRFTPSASVWSARTAAQLDALTAGTDGQPLQPPPSIANLRRIVSNIVPDNLGVGTDESMAVLADWSQVIVGVRQIASLELTYDGSDSADSTYKDSFSQHMAWFKCTMRVDVVCPRPKAIGTLTGIDPAA